MEVGVEGEILEKAEIPEEKEGEMPGNQQIEVLGQLFPGRSRGSLEAALRESGGDLVKALEKCARSGRELLMQQAALAATAAKAAAKTNTITGDINANAAAAANTTFSAMALASSSRTPSSSPNTLKMRHAQVWSQTA